MNNKKTNNKSPTNTNVTVKPTNNKENEEIKLRKEQSSKFEAYIHESGLAMAFQLVFAELISKKISTENYFSYVTVRLKEIGMELESLKKIPNENEKEIEDNHNNTNQNESNHED